MRNVPARSVSLADGRRLGYHEFGDPGGAPCLYTPGWPASGLLGGIYDDAAREAGVRWISIDKPGAGTSDFDPHRSLLRYGADTAVLADHLDLDRFAVVGESGGSPHALAMAHTFPGRLTTTILLAGMGPFDEKPVRDATRSPNRWLFASARSAPWLLRAQTMMLSRMLRDPRGAQRWNQTLLLRAPEADRRAFQLIDSTWLAPATADALRDGGRAATQELTMITRAWGFSLSEITAPVELWHGTEDRNVPPAVARWVVDALPECKAHILDGEGHSVGAVVRDDVMASILRAADDARG